jgi:TonB family protein
MAVCCCLRVKANDTTFHKNRAIHFVVSKDTLLLLQDENGANLMKQGRWVYTYINKNGRHCGFSVRDNNIIEEAYYVKERDGSNVDTIFTALPLTPSQKQQLTERSRALHRRVEYPSVARRQGISGKVVLSFVIDTAGHVTDLSALTHFGYGLEEAAIAAARDLKVEPVLYNGRAVNMAVRLPVMFMLQ